MGKFSRWMRARTHASTRTRASYPSIRATRNAWSFQPVAPTNTRTVVQPTASSHPHRTRHFPPRRQLSREQWTLGKYFCSRISLHIEKRDSKLYWKFYAAIVSKCRIVINLLQFLIFYCSPPRQWYVLAGQILLQNNITTVRRHFTGNKAFWCLILFLWI
jgi:hypothetical protein